MFLDQIIIPCAYQFVQPLLIPLHGHALIVTVLINISKARKTKDICQAMFDEVNILRITIPYTEFFILKLHTYMWRLYRI